MRKPLLCHEKQSKMEKPLERHMDELMTTPGVTGVLCSDNQGLTLSVRGNASLRSAGLVSNLAHQAHMLHPEIPHKPVICLESDEGNVLIKSEGQVTMSIHRYST